MKYILKQEVILRDEKFKTKERFFAYSISEKKLLTVNKDCFKLLSAFKKPASEKEIYKNFLIGKESKKVSNLVRYFLKINFLRIYEK
jgi:hypothetical protein